jgi:hypothetical protein
LSCLFRPNDRCAPQRGGFCIKLTSRRDFYICVREPMSSYGTSRQSVERRSEPLSGRNGHYPTRLTKTEVIGASPKSDRSVTREPKLVELAVLDLGPAHRAADRAVAAQGDSPTFRYLMNGARRSSAVASRLRDKSDIIRPGSKTEVVRQALSHTGRLWRFKTYRADGARP